MSGRIRIVKRRIRDLEAFLDDAQVALIAYDRVIRDCSGLGGLSAIMRRRDWWIDRRELIMRDLDRENDLLSSMPKRHGESPHDPGDEQEHRSQKAGERP